MVVVGEEGGIAFIHNDDLYALLKEAFPDLQTVRASHVEPTEDGSWEVDVAPLMKLLGGSTGDKLVIGSAPRRDEALALEAAWVQGFLKGGS